MSGLSFTAEAAKRLEDLYMTADVVAQRSYALQKLRLRPGQAVVDIGSGPGFLCDAMAGIVGASGRIRGIDLSSDLIERSADRNPYPWASFRVGDATALDEPDESFDVVTCAHVGKAVHHCRLCSKPAGTLVVDAANRFLYFVTALVR